MMTDSDKVLAEVLAEVADTAVTPDPVIQKQPDEVAALCADLEKKEQAAREAQDRYLRTLADFENYRKRSQKEQAEQARFANERLIKELLPVIDNLERALSHSRATQDFANMLDGIALVHKQQLSVLSKFGVRPIESLNAPFDPLIHQSIGQVDLEVSGGYNAEDADNRVASEAQRGYFLHERVLRPALVVIGVKKKSIETTHEQT